MLKWIAKIVFSVVLVWGVCRFCHTQTDGFRLSKIQNNTFDTAQISSSEEERAALEMLEAPYTYLARGKQSFVFLAQDGKSVLKLLNNHYQSKIAKLSWLPSIRWRDQELSYFKSKMDQVASSYRLSNEELKNETGVLYLHLNRSSHLRKTVTIIDKLGIRHEIDLDSTAFILQKSATLAYPQFEAWLSKGDLASAKKGISSLLALVRTRLKKELTDKDPLIRTNIGFIDGKASFLDLGPFSKNDAVKPTASKEAELDKITHSLKNWLEKRDPQLALFLEEELKSGHEF